MNLTILNQIFDFILNLFNLKKIFSKKETIKVDKEKKEENIEIVKDEHYYSTNSLSKLEESITELYNDALNFKYKIENLNNFHNIGFYKYYEGVENLKERFTEEYIGVKNNVGDSHYLLSLKDIGHNFNYFYEKILEQIRILNKSNNILSDEEHQFLCAYWNYSSKMSNLEYISKELLKRRKK